MAREEEQPVTRPREKAEGGYDQQETVREPDPQPGPAAPEAAATVVRVRARLKDERTARGGEGDAHGGATGRRREQ